MTNAGFGALVLIAVVIGSPAGWLGRTVARIGSQSYSIYLWHQAVLGFGVVLVPRLIGRPATFYETVGWYVPLAFAIGVLAAKCVEFPVLRLRDRIFPDDRSRAVAVAGLTAAVSPQSSSARSVTT